MSRGLTASECEFFAEDVLIEVVPRFESSELELISGRFGPFIPQTPISVPLWLALQLKKEQKCQISCPHWMRKDHLESIRRSEKDSQISSLESLPEYYVEVSQLLLQYASDDVSDIHHVRSLLEDIENLRQHKIRVGLQKMAEEQLVEPLQFLRLNNASALEVNAIRPLLLKTLGAFYKLYSNGSKAIRNADEVMAQREEARERWEIEQREEERRQSRNSRVRYVAGGEAVVASQQSYDSDDDVFGSQEDDLPVRNLRQGR